MDTFWPCGPVSNNEHIRHTILFPQTYTVAVSVFLPRESAHSAHPYGALDSIEKSMNHVGKWWWTTSMSSFSFPLVGVLKLRVELVLIANYQVSVAGQNCWEGAEKMVEKKSGWEKTPSWYRDTSFLVLNRDRCT